MDGAYNCSTNSDDSKEKGSKVSEEVLECNRIFLNFTRDFSHPAKDKCVIARVKDLFKYLSERQDLQEMKVSGWSDEGKPETGEEEGEVYLDEEMDFFCEEEGTPKGGGRRFAMSRDFWYRKLNTLKAQKLDEAALEAKDIPPDDEHTEKKSMNWTRKNKVYSSQIPETRKDVLEEICRFEQEVAKPAEALLKKQFVNVYNTKTRFKKAN